LPPLPPRAEQAAGVRFLVVEPGRVRRIEGIEKADSLPGVISAEADVVGGGGDLSDPHRDSSHREGDVIVVESTVSTAIKVKVLSVRRRTFRSL
jgi:hypothetical protein